MQNRISCSSTLKAVALAATVVTTGAFAQDECATAIVLSSGVPAAFSTAAATVSAEPIPTDALCAGTYLDWVATQADVWCKFTATATGQVTFSTCDAASYDTSIALYLGDCVNLVACNGDGTGLAGCQAFYSLISNVNCAAGDVFYLRVGGWGGDVGTGTVTATFVEGVAGCAGATGACNVAHGGLGCDNLVCCSAVCPLNPLCCELGWDQACVDQAIVTCGYYQCLPAGGPANDCATAATAISNSDSTVNWSNVGATEDGPDHASICASGVPDFFNDVWYKVLVSANGSMVLSTCGMSPFDNKTGVYDMGTDPAAFDFNGLAAAVVACNDDGAGGTCMTTGVPPTSYASAMTAAVQMGHTYLIRIGSYANGDTGAGQMTVDLPEPCDIGTAGGTEGESCGSAFNDGCNGAGESETLAIGSSVAGTFWADADTRDTDFYQISVTAATQVTASLKSARLSTVLILSGDITVAGCTAVSVVAVGSGSCPSVASACLNPGTYYVFVGEQLFAGNPCGSGTFNDYTLSVTGAPASCPVLVSGSGATAGVCDAPGPDTMNSDTAPLTVSAGLVACGVNPAAPNCSGGGTVGDDYARVFPAGMVTGDISCLNFGVFSVKRAVNGTACASFYSDIALPATIGIYRDLDGGEPRWYTADGGTDGNDLELIAEQDIMVAGGVYLATLNFDQPICVQDDAANNLVVILDTYDLYGGVGAPAASGYGLRAAGNTPTGTTTSNTYWSSPGCGIGATNFVLTQTAGATFLAHWIVTINGTNAATCSAPACIGDYNGDGIRNGADLSTLLSGWGTPAADITGDGTTNGADLTALLSGWGACPN